MPGCSDVFCNYVSCPFLRTLRLKARAAGLDVTPSIIKRGSQNAKGLRVKNLCRVRKRVSVEKLFHDAPLLQAGANISHAPTPVAEPRPVINVIYGILAPTLNNSLLPVNSRPLACVLARWPMARLVARRDR